MDDKTQPNQVGWSRGKLLRLEKNQNMIKRNIDSTISKRLVIGVVLLIGVLVLIVSLINGNAFFTFASIAVLIIGGFMFAKAMVRIDGARNAMEVMVKRVNNAKTRLTELIAQEPRTE